MPVYKHDDIYAEAIKAIEENENVFFIEDVVSLVSCGRTTFYTLFPDGSDSLNNIKEKLTDNKINMKVKLRNKLAQGDKAAEIISLYKLIATEEERRALSMTQIDHTTKGEKITPPVTWASPEKDEASS